MIKFYHGGSYTCAIASLIALEEASLKYELIRMDMAGGQQRTAEYLAVNPKGRVPALATEKGILTENPAILAYIAQIAPEANLAPLDDPFEFARMQAFNIYLCSTVHVAHAHRVRGSRWADNESSFEDMKRRVPGNMAECMRLIEADMFKGPWVMGDQYTVADPYLFTMASWLENDGVDIREFPVINDFFSRMKERPAVQRTWGAENA